MSVRFELTTGLISLHGAPKTGLRKFGVPPGGPFDSESSTTANSILGNDRDAPILELALVNARVTFEQDTTIAIVGAGHRAVLDGEPIGLDASYAVKAGSILVLSPIASGLRCYIGLQGGVQTTSVLNSFSAKSEAQTIAPFKLPNPIHSLEPGPFRIVTEVPFPVPKATVSARIDRVGLRLDAPGLGQGVQSEVSRPTVFGAVQRTPSGELLIHGPDGPTIGGYELLGVVAHVDLDRLAHLRPGQIVEFVQISVREAQALRKSP